MEQPISTEFKTGSEAYIKRLSKKSRTCEHCKKEFSVKSNNQKICKICVPNEKARSLMKHYILSYEEYILMMENNQGICPICGKRKAIVVDHNHNTGEVRGMLCNYCNLLISGIEDQEILKRAINYLGA